MMLINKAGCLCLKSCIHLSSLDMKYNLSAFEALMTILSLGFGTVHNVNLYILSTTIKKVVYDNDTVFKV